MSPVVVTYIEKEFDVLFFEKNALSFLSTHQLIVSCSLFSSQSNLSFEVMCEYILRLKKQGYFVAMEWNTLLMQSKLMKLWDIFKKVPLIELSAIRIRDLGCLELIKNEFPWLKVHMIVDNGCHNLTALQTISHYSSQVSRLVISSEITKNKCIEYIEKISTPIEILGLGPILLFYSPRKLITPLGLLEENKEVSARSVESPHKGFLVTENENGTLMFNVRDLDIMNDLPENLAYVRIDTRYYDDQIKMAIYQGLEISGDAPRKFFKGLYQSNKTDVLFNKIKNKVIERRDENYLGLIADVDRDRCITIKIGSQLNRDKLGDGTKIRIYTPENKMKDLSLSKINDLPSHSEFIKIRYIKGVTVKSQVYFA